MPSKKNQERLKIAVEKLKIWQGSGDKEVNHWEADKVLCDLLTELGFEEVVEEWDKVGKWYA